MGDEIAGLDEEVYVRWGLAVARAIGRLWKYESCILPCQKPQERCVTEPDDGCCSLLDSSSSAWETPLLHIWTLQPEWLHLSGASDIPEQFRLPLHPYQGKSWAQAVRFLLAERLSRIRATTRISYISDLTFPQTRILGEVGWSVSHPTERRPLCTRCAQVKVDDHTHLHESVLFT